MTYLQFDYITSPSHRTGVFFIPKIKEGGLHGHKEEHRHQEWR